MVVVPESMALSAAICTSRGHLPLYFIVNASVRYRIQYKILLTTYKASHLLAPCYLSDLLEFYQPIRTLRSSSESLLVVNRAHLRQFGDRAFCIATPHLWNDLPRNMRTCDSIYQFKRLLKTCFFQRAFYS